MIIICTDFTRLPNEAEFNVTNLNIFPFRNTIGMSTYGLGPIDV